LPDAEALVIVKEIWLHLYLIRLIIPQQVSQQHLTLKKSVYLGKSAWILCTEQEADIPIFLITMGDWSLI
jgi:hypothetical protein